jgi:acyl carrier protein
MDFVPVVRQTASEMRLLDATGNLKRLDSLTIIDFVVQLEAASGVEIPTVVLRHDTFESIETVAEMLQELKERG